MENHFVKIIDTVSFEELLTKSTEGPVVIFKHSTTCPISAAAYREMTDFNREVALVEVQGARDLSEEIERRTGVSHQSPQVLVMRDGKVVWQASHFEVTADSVTKAVSENS